MASPLAYEQPNLNKAWQAVLLHAPTIVLIWLVSAVLTGIGYGVSSLITLIGGGDASLREFNFHHGSFNP